MKAKVAIEEIITQTFEVEVSDLNKAYDEIRQMFVDGEFVMDKPTLIEANVMIYDENGEETDWNNLHV